MNDAEMQKLLELIVSWRKWAKQESRGRDWANAAAAGKIVCADELEDIIKQLPPKEPAQKASDD